MSQSKILLQLSLSTMAIMIVGCGGGGSAKPNPPVVAQNNAPTISNFSSEISTANPFEVTFSWTVSDADNDALSCVLSPGNGISDIPINDCLATTSTLVSYTLAGTIDASLTVTDASNASASQSVSLTLEASSGGLPQPIVTAGDNELVVFYNRPDENYQSWVLHLWNNDSCDAYADFASGGGTEWSVGQAQSGIDPNYGAYWVLPLKADSSDCANFIVHKGDEKDVGDADHRADLTGDRMFWTLSGISELYPDATLFPSGVLIFDTAAHWVDTQTVFWDVNGSGVAKVRIYSSEADDLGYNGEVGIAGDDFVEFTPQTGGTHPSTGLHMPRYQDLDAYTADASSTTDIKQMLKGKLLAIAYDNSDAVVAATYVQTPRILDAIYTSGADDANEAPLGLQYDANGISSNVWAPTAQQVNINIYDVNKVLQSSQAMSLDNNTGIWTIDLDNSMDRQFYRFELTVYHYINQCFETLETTDPYAVSLSTNGHYSQFVNLEDNNLKPQNWDTHVSPSIVDPEDAIIYEGHIRDFSIRDESTSVANRGKYLAFTEQDSLPVTHLKSLADAGLTHFQMLPANDIATIGEDLTNRVNISDTVADLCALNSTAPVCGVADSSSTLLSVFESYDPSTSDAQALANAMRGLDSFNWGYDPKHYSTPEGSYASDPDGTVRILEMRSMIQSLHEMGLRVSLDVVYNHTSSSGLFENSVLDKIVPGYYHRRNLTTGSVLRDTCCEDTAPEHTMMNKLMVDSLALWTQAYKFDAFRFDIMSNNSADSILNARDVVQALDSDNYFYGEGWTRNNNGYTQANQNNMAGSQVGTFNDRPRDIIRSASLFNTSGSLDDQDIIRLGLAGTLADYVMQDKNGNVKSGSAYSAKPAYAKDPADVINYVSKHDNETLWDQLQYGLSSDMSIDDRVRVQNIAGTIPLISQGIPFFQLGGDLIRSKSMDRNSYDAGDWFNWVDFTKTSNNWNLGLPLAENNQERWTTIGDLASNAEAQTSISHIALSSSVFKEFVTIRQSSKLFRLTNTQDVIDRVGFHNTGVSQTQGLIVMSLDDGAGLEDLDVNLDAIVVIINGTSNEQSHNILTATNFELHNVQQASADSTVQTASFVAGANSGTFIVPALTTAVFVKPQVGAQGVGLAADVTVNQPDIAPYGETSIYLRGSMNNFGDDGLAAVDSFSYVGNGVYNLDYLLDAGTQSLKIANDDYSLVNLGFSDVQIYSNSVTASADANGNISFTVSAQGNYNFRLDASQQTPVLTINSVSPTVNCSALDNSAQDIPFNIAGGGQLYVRGSHSAWGPDETYRLHYKGNNSYQAVAEFSGDFQFKLASDDASWTTQLWAQAADGNIYSENLAVGVSYPVAYDGAGESNNQTSLAAGTYSFLLTLNAANPSKSTNVGNLIIQECLN
ncbi:alpha-1,6-glucosidase domain-containing protein [Paraglaciecola arctica]|uniref:Pullulanase 1, chloroplastic n=1 Tax=Paraglaciecola arctica BSs20135 TaxID=493475 RepID=K6YE11_9ALTE|nr:alpha-1,6-glucosidase domain-containing protein [Paraglaciecola arctica]GAC22206.1 pullulanase 1, chloroplastic [Paraglaciecola arctica BSs20135]